MKRRAGLMGLVLMLTLVFVNGISYASVNAATKNIAVTYRGIQIYVEGKKIGGEEPFVLNSKGIVMVPVRTVAEAVGKSVVWDGTKNMIYIGTSTFSAQESRGNTASPQPKQGQVIPVTYRGIQIFAGGKIIGGEEPFILDDKGIVMVPIRAVVEATGKSVVWDPKKNTVTISTGPAGWTETKSDQFVWLENMMVIRNVGPFFRQTGKPFVIAAGSHSRGLGVRLTSGSAEVVIRTHGKYKAIEGWLGVDDETRNTSGAFFFSIYADNKEVPSNIEVEGGAGKIIGKTPDDYGYDYTLVEDGTTEENTDEDSEEDYDMNKIKYPVNSDLYERKPVFLSGPIIPASYPKYISPAVTDISGALTVTLKVTWVSSGAPGDYPDLTAVLADFKFIKEN